MYLIVWSFAIASVARRVPLLPRHPVARQAHQGALRGARPRPARHHAARRLPGGRPARRPVGHDRARRRRLAAQGHRLPAGPVPDRVRAGHPAGALLLPDRQPLRRRRPGCPAPGCWSSSPILVAPDGARRHPPAPRPPPRRRRRHRPGGTAVRRRRDSSPTPAGPSPPRSACSPSSPSGGSSPRTSPPRPGSCPGLLCTGGVIVALVLVALELKARRTSRTRDDGPHDEGTPSGGIVEHEANEAGQPVGAPTVGRYRRHRRRARAERAASSSSSPSGCSPG